MEWHRRGAFPADFEARRRLRSASSPLLIVRRTRLSAVDYRAFPGRRSVRLVWFTAARHVCTITACISQSPQYVSSLKLTRSDVSLSYVRCSRYSGLEHAVSFVAYGEQYEL